MNEVLMNDEDMALMYLTEGEQSGGAARDPRQHHEVEMLFENYLFQVTLRLLRCSIIRNQRLPRLKWCFCIVYLSVCRCV